jgi:type VI secretion system protein ImpK
MNLPPQPLQPQPPQSPQPFSAEVAQETLLGPGMFAHRARPTQEARSLLDLMFDGFYMLFLLRQRQAPASAGAFRASIKQFLGDVEKGAAKLGISANDTHLAKYAFCATVDECVLRSQLNIRSAWQGAPLQQELFGELLAGEKFFTKLEAARLEGKPRMQVLKVFHLCLLLGFEGKYANSGSAELSHITARLGEDIGGPPFAPHALPPDNIVHQLKNEVPLWVVASVFALLGTLALITLNWRLGAKAQTQLAAIEGVVQPLRANASVFITLP